FFSSRRRHTRSKRDWSSDVCSSDLCILSLRDIDGVLSLAATKQTSRIASLRHRYNEKRAQSCRETRPMPPSERPPRVLIADDNRSEERRVGKECRCRWATQH